MSKPITIISTLSRVLTLNQLKLMRYLFTVESCVHVYKTEYIVIYIKFKFRIQCLRRNCQTMYYC
jgi:hypothetical protein